MNAAQANNISGQDMYNACKGNSQAEQGFCLGYTIALMEGIKIGAAQILAAKGTVNAAELNQLIDQTLQFCISNLSNVQIKDVFIGHLASKENLVESTARQLFIDAMRDTFPCN